MSIIRTGHVPFPLSDKTRGAIVGGLGTFRVMTFNTYLGLGDPAGTSQEIAKYNAIKDIINRVSPDYLNLNEVPDADYAGVLETLMVDVGLPNKVRGITGSLGNCAISKFPLGTPEIILSTPPAAEMPTTVGIFKVVATFDNKELLIYNLHTEPWCITPPCLNEARPVLEFPRLVQHIRMNEDITIQKNLNPQYHIITLGDHNDDNESPQTASFASEPAGIRGSFILGADIGFPLTYAAFPDSIYSAIDFDLLESEDTAGNRNTINADIPNPVLTFEIKLDYIAHETTKLISLGSEIINSTNDSETGLAKFNGILGATDSEVASDHRPIFADFNILAQVGFTPWANRALDIYSDNGTPLTAFQESAFVTYVDAGYNIGTHQRKEIELLLVFGAVNSLVDYRQGVIAANNGAVFSLLTGAEFSGAEWIDIPWQPATAILYKQDDALMGTFIKEITVASTSMFGIYNDGSRRAQIAISPTRPSLNGSTLPAAGNAVAANQDNIIRRINNSNIEIVQNGIITGSPAQTSIDISTTLDHNMFVGAVNDGSSDTPAGFMTGKLLNFMGGQGSGFDYLGDYNNKVKLFEDLGITL